MHICYQLNLSSRWHVVLFSQHMTHMSENHLVSIAHFTCKIVLPFFFMLWLCVWLCVCVAIFYSLHRLSVDIKFQSKYQDILYFKVKKKICMHAAGHCHKSDTFFFWFHVGQPIRVCFSSYFSGFSRISKFLDYEHLSSFACPSNPSWTFRIWIFIVIDILLKKLSIYPSVDSYR